MSTWASLAKRSRTSGASAYEVCAEGAVVFAQVRGAADGHVRHVRHRSTPPMTGSIEATATMTSATIEPSHMTAAACRLLNEGSRKWTR